MAEESQFGATAAAEDELDFRPHQTGRVATPGIVAARSNERSISLGEARQQLRGEGYDFSRYNEESTSPLSITAKSTQPSARPAAVSDGIDFQPANAAAKPQKSATPAPSDGIDFRAAEKSASSLRTPTLDELSTGRPAGTQTPSLTDRAAKIGRSTTSLGVPDNFFVDATKSARNVFTNEFQQPGMATEEEKARWRASLSDEKRQRLEEFEQRQATEGTPYHGDVVIGQGVTHLARNIREIAGDVSGYGPQAEPSQSLTDVTGFVPPESRREHPYATGVTQAVSGLGSPENASIMLASGGLSSLPALARAGVSAYFAAQMAKGAYDQIPGIEEARARGDWSEVKRLATLAGVNVLMGAAAGAHGIKEAGLDPEAAPSPFVEKGTISGPLAMDRAVARGGRRMEDFQANEAARRGMGNLAFSERAIEAAKQARINEPVEIPPSRGEPTILQGRPQGPERNPLEVEAGRVREEQAAQERPAFTVKDLRRVVPEDPSQPPYYVLGGAEPNAPRGSVERPGAADLVGTRERSKGVSEIASRVLADRDKSLVTRFGPDVLDEARQELKAAAGLASSFERPGRYFSQYGDQNEYMPSRSTSAAKGIFASGTWYGVGSARGDIADMHPWFADVAEGPETFAKIAQEGKGAAFDRILERVATHIQNERESARPVIEEFAPQLQSLALQIHDVDPDLARTLHELSAGKAVGFKNLREYIKGQIHVAETAATFSRAVEDAAAEARESAGAEETAGASSEARETESRGEETTREPAGPVTSPRHDGIDFEPSQPINPQEVEDMSRALGRRVTAEELPGIRRRLEAERNVEAGLRGERRDVAGEIREEHRTKLEHGEILPGMETAVREQREAAATEQGRQLTERANRPPESIEETAGNIERKSPLFRGKGPQGELYSGLNPRALIEGAKVLSRAWDEKVARPLLDKVLKIGDKYQKAREADPAVAEGLHLLDNAPTYLRAKAAQQVHNVIGDLSRAQERLFTLMADADSRENLRENHPQEYRQAQNDPAIQEALKKYKPLEKELTAARAKMGGATIEDDYLRRVYDKYVAGVGHAEAPGTPERGTSAYDRVIRPQRIGNLSREATSEYHYEHGLHEFGPSFATKFIGTHLRALRDSVAREFMDNATLVQAGGSEPRFILYNGERYYRPDVAREMRDGGVKHVKDYDRYDPTAGEKFPVPAEGKYLGPRELVKTLNDFGRREDVEPGGLRRFFQEQIIGFGFGIPHIANIMRRVSQSVPGGAANPKGWVEAWKVALGKELRDRGIEGLNDPTFDMLAKHGAISTGEVSNLKEYIGGNLNPANWARSLAQVGHKVLFEPTAAHGFGGIDQRARLYIADLLQSQRPELSDAKIAEAVRTQLGDYNRANWSDRQKMLARFMMFPGWDFSSIRWVLQHPVKTTVPPALVVLLANQALNKLGQNRAEDKYDISNIHVGDRSYGTSLVRESVARNLFRPAIAYAQAKIRGESDQRALAEAARGVTSGAGGLLGMLRPDLSGFLALATNRQGFFSSKEIVSKDDYAQPGKLLPSRAIEKEAVFALRHAVPALDRMLDSNEEIDLRSFAGGNLGVPNYRDDAEKRLLRNASEAEEVHRTIGKLAKSNPELAREYVKDPDNAAFALFYHDLNGLGATLRRMDEAKQRIDESGLPREEKKARTATIDKARENLLRHADGLNNLLFERRQKGKTAPGIIPRSVSEGALRVLQGQR